MSRRSLSEVWAEEQAHWTPSSIEEELPDLKRHVDDLVQRNGLPLSDMWAQENARHILSRSDSRISRGVPYTNEQAVQAIYSHIETLLRDVAEEHILDPGALRDGVWRKMTLDMARSCANLTSLFAKFTHVLKERQP